MTRIQVITHFVSPYQVELFNRIAARGAVELSVAYLHDEWKGRHWENVSIEHPYCVAKDTATRAAVAERVESWDAVVFNAYRDRFATDMLRLRFRRGTPWAFWGERPAYRYKGLAGTLYRRWRLAALWRSTAPIWGIGSWACDKYRQEFGTRRRYAALPYFSDLERFHRPHANGGNGDRSAAPRRLLFSGALSTRKGVDLLATAFQRVAHDGQNAQLTIVGTGPLEAEARRQLAGNPEVQFEGFRDWPDLPPFYHRADILVAPSRYDGWGLIVPEGLAAGLPVIATDQMGSAIDLLQPGVNGWVCRAGDLDHLTDVLRQALRLTSAQLQTMSRAASASVRTHRLDDGAERFLELCEDLLRTWKRDY